MSPVALPSAQAAVLYAPRDIRIEDRTLWPPAHGQVQLQVVSTGLCGSDLHYYTHGRNGDFAVRSPLVLGHEAAGIVTAIGPGVSDFYVGQRVAIEAGINCRSCPMCDKGRYNLCKNMRFCSSASKFPHVDGTLRTRMNHPAHVLHPLPDNCTFELASLAEPLSVLIHASRRVGLQANQNILVFGVGAIGLLACALAKHTGATRVMAVDINRERLEFAKNNGFCDDIWCPPSSSSSPPAPVHDDLCHPPPASKLNNASAPSKQPVSPSEDQLRRAKESAMAALSHFDCQDGFDIVFECTGAAEAIQTSVFAATAGGKVMLIGMGARNVLLPISTAALREIDIQGSFRYANTYPEALSLLASTTPRTVNGKQQIHLPDLVAKMVTHRFPLADTRQAFELMREGRDDKGGLVLKVVVGTGSPS